MKPSAGELHSCSGSHLTWTASDSVAFSCVLGPSCLPAVHMLLITGGLYLEGANSIQSKSLLISLKEKKKTKSLKRGASEIDLTDMWFLLIINKIASAREMCFPHGLCRPIMSWLYWSSICAQFVTAEMFLFQMFPRPLEIWYITVQTQKPVGK